jgi:hypothetical protein
MQTKNTEWKIPDAENAVLWKKYTADTNFTLEWKYPFKGSGCGNPWNYLINNPALEKEIRDNKPLYTPTPYLHCITSIYILKSKDVMMKTLASFASSDCWAVFTRDKNTHEIIDMHFDHITKNETKESDAIRDQLCTENSVLGMKVIDSLINSPIELIFSTGGDGHTIFQSIDTNTFIQVDVAKK